MCRRQHYLGSGISYEADYTYRADEVRPLPFHSAQRTMAIEIIHHSEMPVPPHDSLPNCEQRTFTRDNKCQGSTHNPYKTKRRAVSAEDGYTLVP